MKNLIPPAVIIIAILFWAFSPSSTTTKLGGSVYSSNGAIPSVKITVLDTEDTPANYYEMTDIEGRYDMTFNAVEGRIIRLKYEKEGYTTLIVDFVPQSNQPSLERDDIYMVKINTDISNSTCDDKAKKIQDQQLIRIYSSTESPEDNYEEILVDDIEYFYHIDKQAISKEYNGQWYQTGFKFNNQDIQDHYLFEHK